MRFLGFARISYVFAWFFILVTLSLTGLFAISGFSGGASGRLIGPLKGSIGGLGPFKRVLNVFKGVTGFTVLEVFDIFYCFYWFFRRPGSTVHCIYMVFSLPETLVKTLAKNLVKNLVKFVGRIFGEKSVQWASSNCPGSFLIVLAVVSVVLVVLLVALEVVFFALVAVVACHYLSLFSNHFQGHQNHYQGRENYRQDN